MGELIKDFTGFLNKEPFLTKILDQDSPVKRIQDWLQEQSNSGETKLKTLQKNNMLELHQAIQQATHLSDEQKNQLHDDILTQTGFKKDLNCHTTLHMAAHYQRWDKLVQLINQTNFKEVDTLDKDRETCLHQLVRSDQADKFKSIMDKVNDDKKPYLLKPQNRNGQPLPHLIMDKVLTEQTMSEQTASLWQTLLDSIPAGDPQQILNVTDNHGETILHKAVRNNREDLVNSIKDHSNEALYGVGADTAHTPLHIAVENNLSSMVTALLAINIPMQDKTKFDNPLHTALKKQGANTDIIMALIDQTQYCDKTDQRGMSVLQLAIEKRHGSPIINKIGEQLRLANQLDSQMSRFCDFKKNEGIYHILAQYNLVNHTLVKQSSSHPGLLNRQRTDGKTPLHLAAEQGSDKTFTALINTMKANSDEPAIDLSITDNDGYTAIHRALEKEHKHLITQNASRLSQLVAQWENDHVVDTLTMIEQQMPDNHSPRFFQCSSLNQPSQGGDYLIHTAAANRSQGAKIINEFVFNVDQKNAEGDTALHIAARQGNKSVIEPLLNKKADSELQNAQGQKPTDVAQNDAIEKMFDKQPSATLKQ